MKTQLPLYQCHKKVRAAQILSVTKITDGTWILLLDVPVLGFPQDGNLCVTVDAAWLQRNPKLAPGGYFVEYQEGDGYTAYSHAAPFEGGYTLVGAGLDFGAAVRAIKAGKCVTRAGWNGKGMWLVMVKDWTIDAVHAPQVDGLLPLPFIAMKTAQDGFVPWLASQSDVLGEDWVVLD